MRLGYLYFIPLCLFFFGSAFFKNEAGLLAQRGKDGAKTVITAGTVVNEFTALSANAAAGNTTISVASSALNSNGRFSGNLAAGDLVMIIQMQGAAVRGNVSDSTWGEMVSYNECGLYEFQEVNSVPGSTSITLDCPLKNNYTATGRVQVIRLPRYLSLTVGTGAVLATDPWNGTVGGVLAVEVLGQTTVSSGGSVDVSGLGFRGGAVDNNANLPGVSTFFSTSPFEGGEKGEGIAGYQADYTPYGGMYGRGAPANGGGGGNSHNASGGGGSNAGALNGYTGNGNPDNSNPQWIPAWNLCYTGFAASTSSGGGRGGYSYAAADGNAAVDPPGSGVWGGDLARNVGGKGGRPLDYSAGRIFLGGGGGAGDGNDGNSASGANGGGMIYILSYGNIGGSGTLISNGNTASNTIGIGNDGIGGGGGGGTIILSSVGAASGISITANGGAGGSQNISIAEAEGPGGGGGGGYIALSAGTVTQQVAGAPNGTTNSSLTTEFPPNGATAGGSGLAGTIAAPIVITTVNDTVCTGQTATLTASSVPASGSVFWYTTQTGGSPIATGNPYVTPPLTSTTVYYAAVCPGLYREPDTAFVLPNPMASFSSGTVCFNNPTTFTDQSTGGITAWSWSFGDGKVSSFQNPSHTYNSAGTYSVTLVVTSPGGCKDSITQGVVVNPLPAVNFSSTTVCVGNATCFTDLTTVSPGNATAWSWNFGDPGLPGNISNIQNPCVTYTAAGTYSVILTATSNSGCQGLAVRAVEVTSSPQASFTASGVCQNAPMTFYNTSTGSPSQWSWQFGDGGTSSQQNPSHLYAGPGTYSVTLMVSSGSCSDTTTNTVTVYPLPSVNFLPDSVCLGKVTSFSDLSSIASGSITAWSWNFGDGSISLQQNPVHLYSSAGTYSVTLTATSANGCSSSLTLQVMVFPPPLAEFTSRPGTEVELDDLVSFTDLSTSGVVQWFWDFGDGGKDSVRNPFHLYGDTGSYVVTLIVISNHGCVDTIEHPLTVKDFTFYIPNAFTPNEDGINEFFFGKGIGITHYKLMIFDRWGNLVFYCDENGLPQMPACRWDGKVMGIGSQRVVQEDVYVWKVEFTNVFNKFFSYTGTVTVVK